MSVKTRKRALKGSLPAGNLSTLRCGGGPPGIGTPPRRRALEAALGQAGNVVVDLAGTHAAAGKIPRTCNPRDFAGGPAVDLQLVHPDTGEPQPFFVIVAAPGHPARERPPIDDPANCTLGWYTIDQFTGVRLDLLRVGDAKVIFKVGVAREIYKTFEWVANQVTEYLKGRA